jgi:hypothetical protein
MQSVYDAAGGTAGLTRLAAAWHHRVLADEVVSHVPRTSASSLAITASVTQASTVRSAAPGQSPMSHIAPAGSRHREGGHLAPAQRTDLLVAGEDGVPAFAIHMYRNVAQSGSGHRCVARRR